MQKESYKVDSNKADSNKEESNTAVPKLDKTQFSVNSFEEARKNSTSNLHLTLEQRWIQTQWLNFLAYGVDPSKNPKMDKSIFSKRKHQNR